MSFNIKLFISFFSNLPLKDPSDIPDPYVKLLLIPGGPNKKQTTKVVVQEQGSPWI